MSFFSDVMSAAYNPYHGDMMKQRREQEQAKALAGVMGGVFGNDGTGYVIGEPQAQPQGQHPAMAQRTDIAPQPPAGLLDAGQAPQAPQGGLLAPNQPQGPGPAPQAMAPQAPAPAFDRMAQYDSQIEQLLTSGNPQAQAIGQKMLMAKMGYDFTAQQSRQQAALKRQQSAGQPSLSGSDALKDLSKFAGFDGATAESKRQALNIYQQTGDLTAAHAQLQKQDTNWGIQGREGLLKLGEKLAKDLKPNREAVTSYNQLMAGINSKTGIGDVSSLFNFMKTLDPRSTVREGEIDMVNSAMPIFNRLSAKLNNLNEGDLLAQGTRDEIAALAGELMALNQAEFQAKTQHHAQLIPEGVPDIQRAEVLGRGLGWSPELAQKQREADPSHATAQKQTRMQELLAKKAQGSATAGNNYRSVRDQRRR